MKNKYFIGEISKYQKQKGWFFGHFMDDKLLRSQLVEVAYQDISSETWDEQDQHYHKQSIEINIVISGWITLTIDKKSKTLREGQFYVIYPYTVIERMSAGKNTKLLVVRAPSIPNDKFIGDPKEF